MAADRDRDRWGRRDRYDRDDRGFWERAGEHVRSWFDDDDEDDGRGMGAYRGRGRGEGRFRDDVGYGTEGAMRRRGWDVDDADYGRERFEDDDRYGDYARMARSGYGWAGTEGSDWGAERRGTGWRGDRFGLGAGGRYGPGFAGRYGSGESYGGGMGRGGYEDAGYASGMRPRGGRGRRGYGDEDRYSTRWGASDRQEQAARREGPYAGVGPAGYKRSAERITEDVNEALTWEPFVDASRIQVRVEGDEVVLEGSVDSRRTKRAAEEAVERVRGVRDVHNRLRVEPREGGASWGGGEPGRDQGAQGQSLTGQGQSQMGQSGQGQALQGQSSPGRSSQDQEARGRTGERGAQDASGESRRG